MRRGDSQAERRRLFLISLDGRGRNRVVATGALAMGLAGAALLELHQRGCIDLDPRALMHAPVPTGDPFLDQVLDSLVGESGPLWRFVLRAQRAVPSGTAALREGLARRTAAGLDLTALPPPEGERLLQLAGLARACLLGAVLFDASQLAAAAAALESLPPRGPVRALLDAVVFAVAAASS